MTTTVSIELGTSDAIVIFDWLVRVDFDELPAVDSAAKQALTDLFNELEQSKIAAYSPDDLAAARADVTRDT
jgi:hypothetical protein